MEILGAGDAARDRVPLARYRWCCGVVVVAFGAAGFFGFQNAGSDARTSFGT